MHCVAADQLAAMKNGDAQTETQALPVAHYVNLHWL